MQTSLQCIHYCITLIFSDILFLKFGNKWDLFFLPKIRQRSFIFAQSTLLFFSCCVNALFSLNNYCWFLHLGISLTVFGFILNPLKGAKKLSITAADIMTLSVSSTELLSYLRGVNLCWVYMSNFKGHSNYYWQKEASRSWA